jgi:hypothetical protein
MPNLWRVFGRQTSRQSPSDGEANSTSPKSLKRIGFTSGGENLSQIGEIRHERILSCPLRATEGRTSRRMSVFCKT